MNKKGTGEKLHAITFLIYIIIIGGSISIGVMMFFGQEYDTRQIESDILNYKISQCLIEKNVQLFADQAQFEKELQDKCNLNMNVTKEYFLLRINDGDKFDYNWKDDEVKCSFAKDNTNFPKCTKNSITTQTPEGTKTIYILTGSNNDARSVAA